MKLWESGIRLSVLAEVNATELFGRDERNANWVWCMAHAQFVHQEACEFVVHIGEGNDADARELLEDTKSSMIVGGCSLEFIAAYQKAADLGAVRVLFYV